MAAVIEKNRRIQKEARELNIRAGSDVFEVMSRTEWRDWLADRLNGARYAMEVVDFDSLLLPQLDPELVDLVLSENPDTVEVDGESLTIEYGNSCVRANIGEEFARKQKKGAILEQEIVEVAEEEATLKGDGSFTETSNRHFKCGCGAVTRVTKSEWKIYQAGEKIEVSCPACNASGKMQTTPTDAPTEEKKTGEVDLSALFVKFNN